MAAEQTDASLESRYEEDDRSRTASVVQRVARRDVERQVSTAVCRIMKDEPAKTDSKAREPQRKED